MDRLVPGFWLPTARCAAAGTVAGSKSLASRTGFRVQSLPGCCCETVFFCLVHSNSRETVTVNTMPCSGSIGLGVDEERS